VPDGLTRSGRWDDLDTLVTDEVDDALVPQATYDTSRRDRRALGGVAAA